MKLGQPHINHVGLPWYQIFTPYRSRGIRSDGTQRNMRSDLDDLII